MGKNVYFRCGNTVYSAIEFDLGPQEKLSFSRTVISILITVTFAVANVKFRLRANATEKERQSRSTDFICPFLNSLYSSSSDLL
jgi:hypothetical protein